MRNLVVVCLIAMSANAFSADMLSQVQGKWQVDMAATKNVPETKQELEKPKGNPFLGQMLKTLSQVMYEFRKDSFLVTTDGKEWTEEKFKVVKNTADVLVITKIKTPAAATANGITTTVEVANDETMYVYKEGDTLIVRDSEKGTPPQNVPPIVLRRNAAK